MKGVIKTTMDLEAGTITFDVEGAGQCVLDMQKVHESNITHAAYHGMKQRIGDAAALSRDAATGATASPQAKLQRMRALVEYYESGAEDWTRRGEGGGGKALTIEAIARVRGIEYDEAVVRVEALAAKRFDGDTKKALAKLRQATDVADAMRAIRAERAGAGAADADAMVEEI